MPKKKVSESEVIRISNERTPTSTRALYIHVLNVCALTGGRFVRPGRLDHAGRQCVELSGTGIVFCPSMRSERDRESERYAPLSSNQQHHDHHHKSCEGEIACGPDKVRTSRILHYVLCVCVSGKARHACSQQTRKRRGLLDLC